MNIDKLINVVYKYVRTRDRLGDLSDVDLSRYSAYEMKPCTPDAKQEFDNAKHELDTTLNNYIDSRVKTILKTISEEETPS